MKVPSCPLASVQSASSIPLPPWALAWGPARLWGLACCLQGRRDTCTFKVHDLPPKDLGRAVNTPITLADGRREVEVTRPQGGLGATLGFQAPCCFLI